MFKKTILSALFAVGLVGGAYAEEHVIKDFDFSFEGPFGTYDKPQLQRGLQVYTQVCSACHGLGLVAFRNLGDKGGPELEEEQVKAYANQFDLMDEESNRYLYDPEKDEFRTFVPSDKFPVNNTQGAPDLSLMAKARAGFHGPYGLGINQIVKGMGGAEYIASILTGYNGEEKEEVGSVLYENHAFPTAWIAMAPPLYDEAVEYIDGSDNDTESLAKDVSAFLMWAAEPKMTARKETGFLVFVFLVFLASLLYLTNKRLWAPHKRKD